MKSSGKQAKATLWVTAIALSLMLMGSGKTAVGLTKRDVRRIDKQGPVEISVVYLNPLEQGRDSEPSFEVRMNTHSVDLEAYDMEKLCFLRIDGGQETEALGWLNSGGGGHHISGILKFARPIPSDTKSLQLIIRQVGGVPERVFEWKLPLD